MGITPDDYQLLLKYIRADAEAHGGKYRTKRVVEALRETDHDFSENVIGVVAGSIGLKPERGPESGTGKGGRKEGAKDLGPRKRRGADPDRPSRQNDVYRLRDEHPEWTLEEIGNELGITKAGVSKHLIRRRPQ